LRLLARDDIERGRGLVFIDMKGDREQAHTVFELACQAGRKDDFLFFTTDVLTPCHSYNGTAYGTPDVLVDRLMMSGDWSKEPFYPGVAQAALDRVIPALASRDKILTPADIRLAVGEKEALRLVSSWASSGDANRLRADLEHWPRYYDDTAGLRSHLDHICRLRDRMCTPVGEINFREVFSRNRIAYIELNAQMHEKLARSIARLMLEDFKQVSGYLASHPDERHPFSLYVDEARNAVYPGFVGLISQCRSAGIGVVLATQSPFDFQEFGDAGVMRAIAQNTGTKLFFHQTEHASAEYCAQQAGTCESVKRTTQRVKGAIGEPEESGVYSDRDVREFIAHPDKLKRMPKGMALIIRGEEECDVLDVDYQPVTLRVPFPPALPRKWRQGDERWLGYDRGALDLAKVLEEEQVKAAGEVAKRGGGSPGPDSGPVRRPPGFEPKGES
jgi:hypothetical protein